MIPKCFKDLNIPEKEYFLTGSRALDSHDLNYIISSDESDYDYVVNIYYRSQILKYIKDNNIELEDSSIYNGGFKFIENGKLYNLITPIEIEFRAWKESLEILKYLIKIDYSQYRNAIKNKKIRYSIYEQLRGLCKSIITFGELL